jgi:hypothetical protein
LPALDGHKGRFVRASNEAIQEYDCGENRLNEEEGQEAKQAMVRAQMMGGVSFLPFGRFAAKKGGDFVAISTKSHGAPATTVSAGIIIEKEAAGRICAPTDRGTRAFDEELGSGTGESGEEPVQPAFAGDEFEGPHAATKSQFIVAFRYAKNFIDWLDPRSWELLLVDDAGKNCSERLAKAEDAEQRSIDSLGLCEDKRAETGGAVVRD